MRKPKWARLEQGLKNDGGAILYALEMRIALLESDKFPALRPLLEQEIAEFQTRFDEIAPLYQMALKRAEQERADAQTKAQAGKAPETPAKGQ